MRGKRIAVLAVTFASLLTTVGFEPAVAASSKSSASKSSRWSDLQRKIRDTQARIRKAKAKERGLIAQINASDLRRQRLEAALASLGYQLNAASARLDVLEHAAGRAAIELDARTKDLEHALSLLDEQTNIMNNRAAEKYIAGPMSFTPVLFNSTDFISFIAADQYVESVLQSDIDTVRSIRAMRDEIAADRTLLDERKQVLDEQVTTMTKQRDEIAAMRARQARARRAVINEINYRKSLLERVRDEREAYEEALASYQRESDSIAGLLRDAQKGQKVIQGAGKGYLVWPVSGTISSGYGWRTHPVHKKRAFHTGIDIATKSGTKVGAARAGKVVYTGYKGAFGLIVLVDHGDSVATMYSHLSKATVRKGDKVKRGEQVGAIGCTGWCTGPHLHFEVRVEGEPTNPMRWLS